MTDSKNKIKNAKDKISGEVKEVIGKITNNEQLELEGKIQSAASDLKEKTNIANKVNDIKEGFAGKINDIIDKNKTTKKGK
ncbi:MAG: CsbD family protein [Sedimentibacter sp.]